MWDEEVGKAERWLVTSVDDLFAVQVGQPVEDPLRDLP